MNIPEFNNKSLLEQVFIHRSYLNESEVGNLESNERLEFLGDSILSLVVSDFIFRKYSDYKEGQLTNIRSVLTNTETFFELGKKLDLGARLKLSKGEEQGGGRNSKTILANTFEALVGGIYIDQGLDKAREFINKVLLEQSEEIVESQGLKDPKSMLQEVLQEKHKESPTYRTIREEGPDHDKLYTIGVYIGEKLLAEGVGSSKQEAEKNAAKQALLNL